MYAIVEIAGQQFKVEEKQRIYVHRLEEHKVGDTVDFSDVLLIDNAGKVNLGSPTISGAKVSAKVLDHLKGEKILVFKKKRRKGYRKKNGHRQYLTQLEISSIVEKGAKKAAKKEEAPKRAATPKKEAAAKKAEPAKKAAPKKSAAKGDDLKKIEGIGPKIAEILTNAGIGTFAKLAKADAENVKEILAEAGSRYKMYDPTAWGQQAALAADGKWDELKELQDKLDGGK